MTNTRDAETRPEGNRPGSNDLLAGGITDNYTALPDLPSDEHAVVGAKVLADVGLRRRVHQYLRNDDLADPVCRLLDAAMRSMDEQRIPVDTVTLAGFIEQHRLAAGLTLVHIRSTIAAIADAAPVPASALFYAHQVVQMASRRTIVDVGRKIQDYGDCADFDDLLDAVGGEGRRAMLAINRALAPVAT